MQARRAARRLHVKVEVRETQMRKFILLPLSMLILTTSAAAAEGRTGADDTIRFIATPRTPNIVLTDKQLRQWESMGFPNMAAENPPKGKEAPPTYLETTATELKDPLKKVRVA